MNFFDYVILNPQISLKKGKVYPFVEMGNVSTVDRMPVAVDYKAYSSGVKFQKGDTVIARITPCLQNGKRFFCKDIEAGFGSTEYLVFRPKNDSVDNLYLYYFMKTEFIKQSMINSMTGATGRQRVNNEMFNDLDVDFPSIESQRKIGNILSAYDDLIENNQKQIRLLEEAARRLYKEWFVDLHFPGHEDVPLVDGVPEGWSIKKLSEIAVVNRQGISKTFNCSYLDYIDLSTVSVGKIAKPTRYKLQDAPGRAKRVAKDGDIAWGMVRPNLKSYALILNPSDTTIFSTGFAILSAETVPFTFLYCHVTQDAFVSYLVNCTNGSTYPAVKPIHFEEAKLLVPDEESLRAFHVCTEPLIRKIECLTKQITSASEARDRLLPKLMSGEMEV